MKRASAARYDSSFDAIADESRVRDVERLSRFSRILKWKNSERPWNIERCNRCYREQTRKRFNYISRDARRIRRQWIMTSRDIKANDTLFVPKKATGKPDAGSRERVSSARECTSALFCSTLKRDADTTGNPVANARGTLFDGRCGLSLPDRERLNEDRCSNLHL